MRTKSGARARRSEYGDFQTPIALAERALHLLRALVPAPALVVEPTCGKGGFLRAAAKTFPKTKRFLGADLDRAHLDECRRQFSDLPANDRLELLRADFFAADWRRLLDGGGEPLLIVGNPPWVTNSTLGRAGSANTPPKRRQPGQRGIEALTGKSNFDISESMLHEQLSWLDQRSGALAVLVKESVARKVLARTWSRSTPIASCRIHRFDAARHFGVAAAACLLLIVRNGASGPPECPVHADLDDGNGAVDTLAFRDGAVVRDPARYDRLRGLRGNDGIHVWRSGVKHDCARVMELRREGERWRNGFGETVRLERDPVYPLLKSSDIAGEGNGGVRKWVIVTQKRLNEDPAHLRQTAPRTWEYLNAHRDLFERRASSIYRGRPSFCMFGVGDYAFAPWKVAIPGFYRTGSARVLSPVHGRPVLLDDTVYFLSCSSEAEAAFLGDLLNSDAAQDFLSCFRFPDSKRPVNAEILRRLHLGRLARTLGRESEYESFAAARRSPAENGRRRLF